MEELLLAFRRGISRVLKRAALAGTQRTKLENPGSGKWVGLTANGQSRRLPSQELASGLGAFWGGDRL